jgi:Zn-dependent protease with chaperone function
LACAVCATINRRNRRLELAADRRAARLVGYDPCRAMLSAVGEDRHWSRLSSIPILCLLMTHPPLAERLAALTRSA